MLRGCQKHLKQMNEQLLIIDKYVLMRRKFIGLMVSLLAARVLKKLF